MGIKKKKKHKKQKMKVLCLLAIVAVASAELFVVDVAEDVANAEGTGPSDRTIICNFFGQSRCTTACSGQSCYDACTWDCGFGRTGSVLCSAVASTTCVTTAAPSS